MSGWGSSPSLGAGGPRAGPAVRIAGLDGIRAMAITGVLAYHADLPLSTGGFLGISQFFTLSGFLITGLLLDSRERLDLLAFWRRRYRRLLPAAYLALGIVVLFGASVATEQQLDDLPSEVTAAIGQVANWFLLANDQSYAAQFAAPSPVQHFWSLSVEEQFYVVFPLLFLVLRRWLRSARALGVALAVGAVSSSAAMFVLYERGASLDRLYYGTDTRAAELLVGASLACFLHQRGCDETSRRRSAATRVAGVIATTVLMASWATIDFVDAALWRGGLLIGAVLSGIMILSALDPSSPVSKLFGSRPLAAVGRVSYGLYLFHWPVFLWLTPERTGLGTAPLLVVRLAVTATLAAASYHLLEMPIRRRSALPRGRLLRWGLAPMVVVLIGGATLVGSRDVHTDLAGLDEQVASPVVAIEDEPLRVLAIVDERALPRMRALADAEATLELTLAPLFGCERIEVDGDGHFCRDWVESWAPLLSEVRPHVVLFAVTDWQPSVLSELSGTTESAVMVDFAKDLLDRGLQMLSADGATVLWAPAPLPAGDALRHRNQPFFLAIDRLLVERPWMRRAEVDGASPDELAAELRLHLRRSPTDLPRVLVVGDSSSRTLGYGLERWAQASGRAVVWSAGTEGCGVAVRGEVRDASRRSREVSARCRDVPAGWAEQVRQFNPDVVLVLSTAFDLQPRRLEAGKPFLRLGDPAFDENLIEEYMSAVDVLSSRGAKIVWMTNPCQREVLRSPVPVPHDDQVRHANGVIIGELRRRRPQVRTFDLFKVLCPEGSFELGNRDVAVIRPDGIHFSAEGAQWFAERYGEEVLSIAR